MVRKKGSGEIITTVVFVVIILGIAYIFISTTLGGRQKRQDMIFDEIASGRAKSIASVLNKSLSATWQVSGDQNIFKTGDKSINCGIDDDKFASEFSQYRLGDGYWYRYDPTYESPRLGLKTSSCVDTDACGDGVVIYGPRIPEEDKYSHQRYNPRVCYPRMDDVLESMDNNMELYEKIENQMISHGNEIEINDITHDITIEEDKIEFKMEQDIKLIPPRHVEIDTRTKNNFEINTEFYRMVLAGQELVSEMLLLSDKMVDDTSPPPNIFIDTLFDPSMRYQTGGQTASREDYEEFIKTYIEDAVSRTEDEFEHTRAEITYNDFELIVPGEDQTGIWKFDIFPDHREGIAIHYDIAVKYFEFYSDIGSTGECIIPIPNDYERMIVDAVDEYDWCFGGLGMWICDYKFRNEEIEKLVKAIIQTESAWDSTAVSHAGAIGLMQIMPLTAATNCGIGDPDELYDPETNIECGVEYLHDIFDSLKGKGGGSKDNLIKISLADYNGANILANYGGMENIFFEDIIDDIPDESAVYVPIVLGHYICYGGEIGTEGALYYYDEDSMKTYPRPITLEIKLEDYLPAIFCAETVEDVPEFYWNVASDVICCAEAGESKKTIYTCNAEVSGLEGDPHSFITGQNVECQRGAGTVIASCTASGFNV
ncbi:lytic transglycosylase domain-containing protein [Candidatus Aenigmatarchaeota archaeon]